LSASAACWTATVALLALSTPEAAPFWLKAKYAFIAFTPVTVAWFALKFTGAMPARRGWVLAALSVIPTLRLALLWTDEGRGWLIREVVFERTGSLTHVGQVVYGPLHPYAITYNYLLIVGAVLLVLMWAARTGPLARPQGLALTGAAVAPVVANSTTLLGATPPDMDPMPLALAMTGALICWSVARHGMLETVLVARDVLLDAIEDVMLATDANGRVIDMNSTMSALLGVPVSSALGRPVSALLAAAARDAGAPPTSTWATIPARPRRLSAPVPARRRGPLRAGGARPGDAARRRRGGARRDRRDRRAVPRAAGRADQRLQRGLRAFADRGGADRGLPRQAVSRRGAP
jgi:PAS domain-containing protein